MLKSVFSTGHVRYLIVSNRDGILYKLKLSKYHKQCCRMTVFARTQPGLCKIRHGLDELTKVKSQFVPVPFGSVLSYLCPLETDTREQPDSSVVPAQPRLTASRFVEVCHVHGESSAKAPSACIKNTPKPCDETRSKAGVRDTETFFLGM